MYDYKSIRRVIRMLAVVFGIVLLVLVVTSYPLNPFAWISVLLLAVVGVYLVMLPKKLLGEMEEMEEIINMYKKKN